MDFIEYVETVLGIMLWPYQKKTFLENLYNEYKKDKPIVVSAANHKIETYSFEYLRSLLALNYDELKNSD